jgi:hypothetical protein
MYNSFIHFVNEKCVYKGKCVSTLIKGKHDMWLARGLTTYKYENENAHLDKNLHDQSVLLGIKKLFVTGEL